MVWMRELISEAHVRGQRLPLSLEAYEQTIAAGYQPRNNVAEDGDQILRAIVLAGLISDGLYGLKPVTPAYRVKNPRPSRCRMLALALVQESQEADTEEAVAAFEKEAARAWKRFGSRHFLRSSALPFATRRA